MKLKKLLLCILIFIGFLLFFNINNVFAFTFTSHNHGVECTVPDLSTVDETQQELLENGYVIVVEKNTNSAILYVLHFKESSSNNIYMTTDNKLRTPSGAYRSVIDLSTTDSWGTLKKMTATYYTYDYNSCDFYYGTTIYTDAKGTDVFYEPSNFISPYILNSAEDLAKGNKDVIIMPR